MRVIILICISQVHDEAVGVVKCWGTLPLAISLSSHTL